MAIHRIFRRSRSTFVALVALNVAACGESSAPPAPSEPIAVAEPAKPSEPAGDGAEPEPSTPESAGETGEPEATAAAETGGTADAKPALLAEKPDDYGSIRPPLPLPAEADLTLHALAGYEVVAVYSEPSLKSARLGYLRFGQRIMVAAKTEDQGEGCRKGFHALPMGGFACASKGLIVDEAKAPYMYLPPPPPRMDTPLPYDYGTIGRDGTPMWWRIADSDEVRLADEKYVATLPPEERPTKPTKSAPTEPKEPVAKPLPGVTDEPAAPAVELTEEEKQARAAAAEAARIKAEERAAELAEKAAKLPLNSAHPFLEKGFMITLSEKVREKGRRWWRTTRGGFVEAKRAWRRKTLDFEGGALAEGSGFPFGFVMEEKASGKTLDDSGKLKRERKLEHRELIDFAEEVEIEGKAYMVTADGLHVLKKHLRLAVPAERPAEVAVWERWIDVSLEQQVLVAYEGETPVYATLVSTGKKGTDEESFETPKGQWRIRSKHISSSMDGNTASDGNYSIQDVPWTMFFEGSYALHGAFWHSRFGRRRSHGCVNLGPTDARWVFNWTMPILPEGWHGVNAHDGAPGTMVVVH